ncbi:hypothetical protein HMF7854_14965 [Sphingomonas ginkgonis]|uniref:Long-chain fatty acid--CoA ligase n=1 Tax=Sphingomonas ginkgonis TaxID=2315330 RepID=A0A3R9YP86_9SPHN|nr:class I adenylate-forming enzyme family protein [Sphingomonas ginkgonis]RST31996.1 hypothetical protein HMF7854_14965 [Sphingomonas ginkgonis]
MILTAASGETLWARFERVAAARADHPALIQGDTRTSFAELAAAALRYGRAFRDAGVRPGDRCLFFSTNRPELAAAMLGAWRAGAVVALLNDEAPLAHLEHAIRVVAPAALVTADSDAGRVAGLFDGPLVALGGGGLPPADNRPAAIVDPAEPASIFFTSGSTGMPKGVTQSHRTLVEACISVGGHLGLGEADRILCPIPWSFDYGYGQLLSTLLLGVTQLLPTERNALAICAALEAQRPTVFAGLPSIFALLLRGVSTLRTTDTGSVRLVTNTGGPIPDAIFAELQTAFPASAFSLNYGMTETYRSAGLPPALAASHPHSVGLAYPGVDLRILREDGSEAGPDEVGELVHRGTGVFMGYWGDPEATARVLRPDPFAPADGQTPKVVFTGDLAVRDREGLLTIRGRRDRLIKSMGVRVSPDEIEALLHGSGLVAGAVVAGLPHDIYGQMVVAAVVARPGIDGLDRQLKAFARTVMSRHMQPRHYLVVEQFPLTPNGKPDHAAIRRLLDEATANPRARSA